MKTKTFLAHLENGDGNRTLLVNVNEWHDKTIENLETQVAKALPGIRILAEQDDFYQSTPTEFYSRTSERGACVARTVFYE